MEKKRKARAPKKRSSIWKRERGRKPDGEEREVW